LREGVTIPQETKALDVKGEQEDLCFRVLEPGKPGGSATFGVKMTLCLFVSMI